MVKSSTGAAGTALRCPRIDREHPAGRTPELAYDLAEADGSVEPLGGAAYYGSAFGTALVAPIVATVSTPDRKGYWLFGADGSVYPFGDARNEGGAGGAVLADPVVAAAATPDGAGYWLVTSVGQVMAFGDAVSYGSDHDTDKGPCRRDGGHTRREGVLDRLQHRGRLQLR